MAGLIAKSVFGLAKVITKYVIIPIAYTALLGYLMQEAADRMRADPGDDTKDAADSMIRPAR